MQGQSEHGSVTRFGQRFGRVGLHVYEFDISDEKLLILCWGLFSTEVSERNYHGWKRSTLMIRTLAYQSAYRSLSCSFGCAFLVTFTEVVDHHA